MKKAVLLIIFAMLIVVAILLNFAPIHVPSPMDKICHFAGFSVLTAFAILAFDSFFGEKSINSFILFVFIFGGVFAAIFEFSQSFVPQRSCDINDLFVNLSAIAFMCAISFLFYSWKKVVKSLQNRPAVALDIQFNA